MRRNPVARGAGLRHRARGRAVLVAVLAACVGAVRPGASASARAETSAGRCEAGCAAAALIHFLKAIERAPSDAEACRITRRLRGTASLQQIVDVARGLGVRLTALKGDYEALCQLQLPVIAHVVTPKGGHFLALESADERSVQILGPDGIETARASEFRRRFTSYFAAVLQG